MSSRRQFLQRCSSALLGSAALPAMGMIESVVGSGAIIIGAATFAKQVNTVFRVRPADGSSVPLTLAAVESFRLPGRDHPLSDENFTLHFTAPGHLDLEQGTFAFHHQTLGPMDIFIVPDSSAPTGTRGYVATFHGAPVLA